MEILLCFAPSACETLCASSKSGVTVSPRNSVACGAPALKPRWPSRLDALGILPFSARPPDCLGYFYVGTSLCNLHGLIFFGVRAVFSMDVCHLFPQCMLAVVPLIGDVTDMVT